MPAPLLRRSLWALGFAAVALVLIVVALPYAASTRIVRDRIAHEMSDWSGLQVSIGATPEISIWPQFQAILTDVSMSLPDSSGTRIIEAERIEVELSAFAALSGDVEFSTARLFRPTLHVEQSASGLAVPILPPDGKFARSIEIARGIVVEDRASPDAGRLPADAFGVVEFSDGRIVSGSGDAEAEIVTGLTGKVDWTALNGQGKVAASGFWRGEEFGIDLSTPSPLLLLGGGTTPLTVTFRSAPANFSFDGTASLMENAYFEGRASFSTPSMLRMLEWSRADILHGSAIGAVGIESRVMGNTERVRFEDAEITLDGNSGSGALDLLLTGKFPVVSGTLAFDALDLRAFLSAFTPLEASAETDLGVIDADFANRLNLDLRLSAAKATAGSIALADVAATARVNDGLAAFDISDATAFGGNIQTGLRFDRSPQGTQVEMRLLASEIDGGAFGAAAGMTRFVPIGRGTVSIILKGQGTTWDALLEHANGSISASFGSGALSGFNVDGFLARARDGGFFALDEVSEGTFPIDALDFEASISDGVATIEKAEARSPLHRIVLVGKVPYTGRGLALSGRVEPLRQAASEAGLATGTSFFVGGSWSAPFISPTAGGPSHE